MTTATVRLQGMTSANASHTSVNGRVDHDAADTTNPVKMGGRASNGSHASVAHGDMVNTYHDLDGRVPAALAALNRLSRTARPLRRRQSKTPPPWLMGKRKRSRLPRLLQYSRGRAGTSRQRDLSAWRLLRGRFSRQRAPGQSPWLVSRTGKCTRPRGA